MVDIATVVVVLLLRFLLLMIISIVQGAASDYLRLLPVNDFLMLLVRGAHWHSVLNHPPG